MPNNMQMDQNGHAPGLDAYQYEQLKAMQAASAAANGGVIDPLLED